MKRIEEIEHKFPALPNVVQEMKIHKIETQEYKEEKKEYKELILELSDDDIASLDKADLILDSITAKLSKLGFTKEELGYLGIEPKASRDAKARSRKKNNGNSSKKK